MYNPEQPVFEEQPESNIEIAYGIEDVPKPCWKAVLFALQITLVDFTPFMWAAGFASLAGIDQPDFVPTLLCAFPLFRDPLPHLCHPWETLRLFTVCQQCGEPR